MTQSPLRVWVAWVGLVLAWVLGQPARAMNYEVYPGSAFYLTQMVSSVDWPFVAKNANGFYHHPVGFQTLTPAEEADVCAQFSNRWAMVEGDQGGYGIADDIGQIQLMTAYGLDSFSAFINRIPTDANAEWRARIATNAAYGVSSYYMLAPHRIDDYVGGWSNVHWEYARTNILATGCAGSGVDAPVYLFVNNPQAYRDACYDLRDWTRDQSKRYIYILSPNSSEGPLLLIDSRKTIQAMEDNGHEPDIWVSELYGERPITLTPESTNIAGVNHAASTILGVAYYLLKHRDGEPGTVDLWATSNATTVAQGVMAPTLSNAAQIVSLSGTGTNAWVLKLTNNSPWLDYAGVFRARATGAATNWNFTFLRGTQNVTSAVLSNTGLVCLNSFRWAPTSGVHQITFTAVPIGAAQPVNLVVEALPHASVEQALDIMAFQYLTNGSAPTLAVDNTFFETRESLRVGPVWFSVGDAETSAGSLTVSAVSSNTTLFPTTNLIFGGEGFQRSLVARPFPGRWGTGVVTLVVNDGTRTNTRAITIVVDRVSLTNQVKANNTNVLTLGSSWTNGLAPDDNVVGVWNSTVTSGLSNALGADLALGGIQIINPGGAITLGGTNTLGLGRAGLDMSRSLQNVTLNCPVSVLDYEVWNVTNGRSLTVTAGITGPGSLTKSGSGSLTVLGSNSFVGGFTVGGNSTVVMTGPGRPRSSSVQASSVLRVSATGGLGDGDASVSAANSDTGRIELTNAVGITVLAGGTMTVNMRTSTTPFLVNQGGSNTVVGQISITSGGGNAWVRSDAGTLVLAGGAVPGTTGTRPLTLLGAATGVVSGRMTNASGGVMAVIKAGTGTWTLSGNNAYTGDTTITNGTLLVNGRIGTGGVVTVSANGVLGGTGVVAAATVVQSTHAPGAPLGRQTFSGTLNYGAAARLRWELTGNTTSGPGTNFDQVITTNLTVAPGGAVNVVLNGATSTVDFTDTFWRQPLSWTLISGASADFALGTISLDSSGGSYTNHGDFALVTNSTTVRLVWTPSVMATQSVTWTSTNTVGTNFWSSGANWSGGAVPLPGVTPIMAFFTNDVSVTAGTVLSRNDLGTLALNQLILAGTGTVTGPTVMRLSGGLLQLAPLLGVDPEIDLLALRATNQTFTYYVDNPLELTTNTVVTGSGTAGFVFTGPISGAGGILKSGTSTLTLAGTNSYAGPTVITAGTVQVGSGGAGSFGLGPVTNSGSGLIFGRTDTALVVSNDISGTAGITIDGAIGSIVTLAGSNSFSGGVMFTRGAVRLVNAFGLGSGNKTVNMYQGSLGQVGIRLDGSDGGIQLGTNLSFRTSSPNTPNAAFVNEAGTNSIAGNMLLTTGGGSTRVIASGGFLTLSGRVTADASGRDLVLDGPADGNMAGLLQNSGPFLPGLVKDGPGTWTISNTNAYDGLTSILGGTLLVNGSIVSTSRVTCSLGATLGGTGVLSAPVTIAGTHQPGIAGPGVQSIQGALQYAATAHVSWDLVSNSVSGAACDLIAAGSVTITNGAVVDVVLNGPGSSVNVTDGFWGQSRTWTLLSAATVTGTFDVGTVTLDSASQAMGDRGVFSVQTDGSSVTLNWTPWAVSAVTESVSAVGATNATFNGQVNPGGLLAGAFFQYGLTTNYGATTVEISLPAGTNSVPVSSAVGGLLPGNSYSYQLVATNAAGVASGSNVVFTTPALVPSVGTLAATSVVSSSAVLNASVNPNGAATDVAFDYGTTTNYGLSVSGGSLPAGNSPVPVSVGVTNLLPGVTYHFRGRATNSAGSAWGGDLTFTTAATAPTVVTLVATNVSATNAVLNASVNPNGAASTVFFQYGTTTNYGLSVSGGSLVAGNSASPVSAGITNLLPGATYHFRAVASNAVGLVAGSNLSFAAPALPPTAVTSAASGIGYSNATLNASVNPNGAATDVAFDFGITTNYGTSVSGGSVSTGNSAVPASAGLTNLLPGVTYHFRTRATNSAGFSVGNDLTFTTVALPPVAPFVQWQATNFGVNATNAAVAGEMADPDGDGVVNLLEYAFARNPLAADAGSLLQVGVTPGTLSLDYVRLLGATDVTFQVQWATNLLTWFTNGVTESTLSTNATTATIRATVGTTNETQKFLRLNVTRP